MIDRITLIGGRGKDGKAEAVTRVEFNMGDVVSIVGPTGSGKTTLINDIELFADGFTPTGRRVLINDEVPKAEYRDDPSCNPIALITQHTNFLSDLPVRDFLRIHAHIRHTDDSETHDAVGRTLAFANELTGEAILQQHRMTELSGGQTRALLIADAVIIGNSPIILLDELENAGIHRTKALDLLRQYRKIFVFVTHDPRIALLSDYRIVSKQGAMQQLIVTGEEERRVAVEIKKLDDLLLNLRHQIREGGQLSGSIVGEHLHALGLSSAA
jgi:ABC-type lipoprotein export system ATPase subunit